MPAATNGRLAKIKARAEWAKSIQESTFSSERENARENLTTALGSRFQWDPHYMKTRADYETRVAGLVSAGHISEDEERDLEEIVFGIACSAANAVAEAWWDNVTRSLLPEVAFEPTNTGDED